MEIFLKFYLLFGYFNTKKCPDLDPQLFARARVSWGAYGEASQKPREPEIKSVPQFMQIKHSRSNIEQKNEETTEIFLLVFYYNITGILVLYL